MKKITFFFLIFTILLSPINKFFISIGIRIQYCEFFSILFILLVLFQKKNLSNKLKLDLIHKYIYIQWLYLIPIFLSLLSFLYIEKTNNEFVFFVKGFSLIFFFLLFISCLLGYLKTINMNTKTFILDLFIYAVAISAIYGLLQIVFFIFFAIDFDKILSNSIPFTGNEIDISELALGSFFRLNGFTSDPSVQASISILVINILMYYIFVKKLYKYVIFFITILLCFILTMSGSGLIGLSVSISIILISRINKIHLSGLITLLLMMMPLIILAFVFKEDLIFFLSHKFESDGTTKVHADIAKKAIDIGLKYPIFGVGFNNFSYVYQIFYGDANYNAHNSWLNYFIEMGIFGFLYKLINSIFYVFVILTKKSNFKFYFLAAFLGLNVSTFGYETLNLFFNQTLLFVLLYYYLTDYFDLNLS